MSQNKAENATVAALQKSNVSRYIQLASLFRQRIESGEWEVGAKIPTVKELSEQCGVATMTIRQALATLEKEGLIARYRAKGTFVLDRPKRDLWCEVKTDWTGMLIARDNATIEILEDDRNVALPRYEGHIGNAAPAYRHLRRRHTRDGITFLLADIYVDERICPQIDEADYGKVTAMRLVSDIPGQTISDANQIVTIGSSDLSIADLLNVSIGEPVAKVQRMAVNQHGDIILLANGVYRGDMMKIEVKLR
ncbi:GntR family transcriptional regulator [Tropicibacter naphthalenivorans]|uniref:HTH-type transcriptional repressor YvoA n=1 Tax=Tropicibacter naphthalenivorans TaxID=441103 RepID=A0A0N7M0N7_9RHOB|nr:GntR family transcriptional regulator [Tropicibacter naphthalenivorans]CUH80977.1 HTH-type transcriptional repressor YvoA [Tropicibacter naphthalenivorans]SMC91514.1 GntR family transcriptional regulator [Tropicibacter naphthalenivorans]